MQEYKTSPQNNQEAIHSLAQQPTDQLNKQTNKQTKLKTQELKPGTVIDS